MEATPAGRSPFRTGDALRGRSLFAPSSTLPAGEGRGEVSFHGGGPQMTGGRNVATVMLQIQHDPYGQRPARRTFRAGHLITDQRSRKTRQRRAGHSEAEHARPPPTVPWAAESRGSAHPSHHDHVAADLPDASPTAPTRSPEGLDRFFPEMLCKQHVAIRRRRMRSRALLPTPCSHPHPFNALFTVARIS